MIRDSPLHRTNILEIDDENQSSNTRGRAGRLEMRAWHDAVKMHGMAQRPFLNPP
jgi:hypothetical protein